MKKIIAVTGLYLFFVVIATGLSGKVFASSLTTTSDTLSTSRPSASSPLSAGASGGASAVSIFNNGSFYLASDSAKIIRTSTNAYINTGLIVASQSAGLTTVNFGNTLGSASQGGTDVLITPITAMHTIAFNTVTGVPVSGKILITFPVLSSGDSNNTASPSASTFQLNGLSSGQFKAFSGSTDITAHLTISTTNPSSGTSPVVTLTLDGSTSISAATTVTIFLGCSAATSSSCSTQVPTIINPTKTATAGTADRWKIRVDTQDASSNGLDTATVAVGVIESVYIQASVDPSLTFTIGGIANGTAINNGNTTGCTNTENTNAGIASTSTVVNLGVLSNTPTATNTQVGNVAAQLLTVSTNGAGGYALTATSSGPLMALSSGFAITSSTTPAVFPNGTPWFGFHPCGLDVSAGTWTSSGANQNCNTYITGSAGNICKYGWPNTSSPLTLASDSTGPIGNSIVAGNGLVSVEYAAGVDASVPAGTYQTVVTYVATPTF